jgi:hypothetical protein
LVSNFVFPSWFKEIPTPSNLQSPSFDYLKAIPQPFQINGYLLLRDAKNGGLLLQSADPTTVMGLLPGDTGPVAGLVPWVRDDQSGKRSDDDFRKIFINPAKKPKDVV